MNLRGCVQAKHGVAAMAAAVWECHSMSCLSDVML